MMYKFDSSLWPQRIWFQQKDALIHHEEMENEKHKGALIIEQDKHD